MKLFSNILFTCIIIGFAGIVSCSNETSVQEMGTNLVNSIRTKNTEQYYSLFPNSAQVAKYGLFAYGLRASSREDLDFWLRPYDTYAKSVDSLEALSKPVTIKSIEQMFSSFHEQIVWDSVEIVSIDTLNTRINEIRDLQDKESCETMEADMNVNLLMRNKKYVLYCHCVTYIEGEGWFLRTAASSVALELRE